MATTQSPRWAILALIVLASWLLWKTVQPLVTAFFLASVLAAALYPVHRRLTRRVRGHDQASSGMLTLGIVLLLVLPTTGVAAYVVREASAGVEFVLDAIRSEGSLALLNHLPESLQQFVKRALDYFPQAVDQISSGVREQVAATGGQAATAVGGMVAATGSAVFQAVMMLIAFFFLLTDGDKLVAWLEENAPLKPGQTHELLMEFRRVSVTVLTSTIATAAVQTAVALVGYLLAQVPHTFFFAIATFLMAFIPTVGAGSVCVIAALVILVTGHPLAALFLAVWGVVAVGLSDNVLKPFLMKGGVGLHGAVVFFSLIGGLAFMGPLGLIAGPLIVTFFLTLMRFWRQEAGRGWTTLDGRLTPGTAG